MAYTAPRPLTDHDRSEAFAWAEPSLDDWLRRRARANQLGGATRTFVVGEETRVIGY
jgi:hypothetical protein